MIRITKAGWIYIAVTIFLGFSAVNTGNNLIFLVVSALLSFMGISGFFGKNNIYGVAVDISVPDEIHAGKTYPCRVTVRSTRRRFPTFLLRVSFGEHTVLFPYIEHLSSVSAYAHVSFPKRGPTLIGGVTVSSVFPFNFFVRSWKPEVEKRVLVFPEPVPGDLPGVGDRERSTQGEFNADKTGHDPEIMSIRDYFTGDPLKFISWKATARTGKLKTKEFASLAARPVIIDFERIPLTDMEVKISRVTHIVIRLISGGVPVGLRIGGKLFRPETSHSHKILLLRELALYGMDETR